MSGNVNIYGRARTGPYGTVSLTGNDKIGATFTESQRASNVAAAIVEGWICNDFTMDVPDVTVPTELTTASNLGTVTYSGNGNITLGPGDYRANSFNFSGNVVYTINGNVRLNISGPVTASGNAKMEILNNSSLTLYAGGSINLSGNGC
jgi:hypothetical protein